MEPAPKTPRGAPRLGLHVQLVDCTETLLSEIKLRESTRKDIAITYAMALLSDEQKKWSVINQAIIDRWSLSGLKFVKRHAWKLVDRWNDAKPARSAPEPASGEGSNP